LNEHRLPSPSYSSSGWHLFIVLLGLGEGKKL
jgi:hypothetical protein